MGFVVDAFRGFDAEDVNPNDEFYIREDGYYIESGEKYRCFSIGTTAYGYADACDFIQQASATNKNTRFSLVPKRNHDTLLNNL